MEEQCSLEHQINVVVLLLCEELYHVLKFVNHLDYLQNNSKKEHVNNSI